jgi:hypothetical protein
VFAESQLTLFATFLIFTVSVRIYQLQKLKYPKKNNIPKNIVGEKSRSLCKGDGHEQLSDAFTLVFK